MFEAHYIIGLNGLVKVFYKACYLLKTQELPVNQMTWKFANTV